MNKKDCEHIGYLLSVYGANEELLQGIFGMDERIESDYIAFEKVHGRSEAVDELTEKLMCERNNTSFYHWSLLGKDKIKCAYSQCLDEARREIYGEDYNSSLFINNK